MSAVTELDWTEANQRLLVAEFARLRALLERGDGQRRVAEAQVEAAVACMPSPAAIDTLADRFGLSDFERDLLLLACGAEMDSALASLATDGGKRTGPTFALALDVLDGAHWSALVPQSPLRRWRLVEPREQQRGDERLVSARLQVDERVLHYVGGLNQLDDRLAPLLERVDRPQLIAGLHLAMAKDAAEVVRRQGYAARLIGLTGDDAEGQADVAASVAWRLGLSLYGLDASDIPGNAHERARLGTLWQREAQLLNAALLIRTPEEPPTEDEVRRLRRFAADVDALVMFSGRHPVLDRAEFPHYTVDKPEAPEQRTLWMQALGESAGDLQDRVDDLAARYRLSARRIAHIAGRVTGDDAPGDPERAADILRRLCRGDDHRLGTLAQRIETLADWQHLVLPEGPMRALRQVLAHARHRLKVQYDWGFARRGHRGNGIATLFTGESGTGKTLAAEVLANALGADLYRVDLSAVVSKYIGETERNLRRIFEAAEDIGALLLFDEADALFGKRSEVKDSHDRYANIEVSYLLQRMEAYRGLAILTTNNRQAMDTAFQRRLRFVVHFPFPDAAQREAIWRVTFPRATPLADLDWAKLARLNVTGGAIRNIALAAAFFAADEGTPVSMRHLLLAAHSEAAKRDRSPSDAETRGWV